LVYPTPLQPAKLEQLVNKRFRLLRQDTDVGAVTQRAFAGVQDGLQLLKRLEIRAVSEETDPDLVVPLVAFEAQNQDMFLTTDGANYTLHKNI